MSMESTDLLKAMSDFFAIFLLLFCSRFKASKVLLTLGMLLVLVFVFSRASFIVFTDRASFMLLHILANAISIMALQLALEAAPPQYRVMSITIVYLMAYCLDITQLIIFVTRRSEEKIYAAIMLLIVFVLAAYSKGAPFQFIRSVVSRDIDAISEVIKKYGIESKTKFLDADAVVDDILYLGYFPVGFVDAVSHLIQITPFMIKLFTLVSALFLNNVTKHFKEGWRRGVCSPGVVEMHFIELFCSSIAAVIFIIMINSLGRRVTIILSLLASFCTFVFLKTIPLMYFSTCWNSERPSDEGSITATFLYSMWTMSRTITEISLILVTFEHIPAIYRSYIFPATMCTDVFAHLATTSFYNLETITVQELCVSGAGVLFIALIIVIIFIDDSEFSAMSAAEYACYDLPWKQLDGTWVTHQTLIDKANLEKKNV
ncbi:unnamed protein product [Caenorhabditis bovis]|nr:unnamed protein product [Caenorhabditis bovis]